MEDLSQLKQLFLEEASDLLEGTERAFLDLETKQDPTTVDQIFRLAHSLKGSGKAVGYDDLAAFTHALETLLGKIKRQEMTVARPIVDLLLRCNDHLRQWIAVLKQNADATFPYQALLEDLEAVGSGKTPMAPTPAPVAVTEPEPFLMDTSPQKKAELKAPQDVVRPEKPAVSDASADETIRVKLNKLDNLVNEVGELVILQTVLKQQKDQVQSELIQKTIDQLSKITRRIQDNSLRLRMIPVKGMFQKMQRVVRDTSRTLGKDVVVNLIGEDIELDKTMVDKLSDPLVHLVRNAIDHGLEHAENRLEVGKPAQSSVWLRAQHQGGRMLIEVRDDGRGIDPQAIRAKAVEKKLIQENAALSHEELIQLIFEPGFSTKSEVSEFSGRGVGLDVVKTNIAEMKGELQVDSVVGKGTTFRIYLPMTLAIIEGIVIRLNENEKYVIPMFQVKEIVELTHEQVFTMGRRNNVFALHGKTVPLYHLGDILNRPHKTNPKRIVAIVAEAAQKQYAFLVEQVINQQQVVIKKLGPDLENIVGISGSAILGDGRAAPILDLDEIVLGSGA